jgi:protein-tyrosine phosphatase
LNVPLQPDSSSGPLGDIAPDSIAEPYSGSRVLALEGGQNFRDLGGYLTCDGRRVKWGKIFRSGHMALLTTADINYLSKLQVRTICDLRATRERRSEPTQWHQIANINYWARDYDVGFGELREVLGSGHATREPARAAMIAGYRRLPFEQAAAYRELFARLAMGEVPLVVNCSAGKDRTGTAAALILSALRVPMETIVEDYLLTEKVLDIRRLFPSGVQQSRSKLADHSTEVAAVVLKADASYLHAAFDAIKERHGTIATYLCDELGVTESMLGSIQQHLLD